MSLPLTEKHLDEVVVGFPLSEKNVTAAKDSHAPPVVDEPLPGDGEETPVVILSTDSSEDSSDPETDSSSRDKWGPRNAESTDSTSEDSETSEGDSEEPSSDADSSDNHSDQNPPYIPTHARENLPEWPRRRRLGRASCHCCRKPLGTKLRVKCFRCNSGFCEPCLKVRHGEDAIEESETGLQWVCPTCRGGCGTRCYKSCCACSWCCPAKGRVARDRKATKVLLEAATAAGACVHDYKIHLKTGESFEMIAKRKLTRGWTKAGGNCWPLPVLIPLRRAFNDRNTDPAQKRKRDATKHIANNVQAVCTAKKRLPTSDCRKFHQIPPLGMDAVEVTRNDIIPAEVGIQFTSKPSIDSLEAIENIAATMNVMKGWFTREKDRRGNRLSITLSAKEAQSINELKGSLLFARDILSESSLQKLTSLPHRQEDLMTRMAMYRTVQQKIAHIHAKMVREAIPEARKDSELAIEHAIGAVQKAVDAIPCTLSEKSYQ